MVTKEQIETLGRLAARDAHDPFGVSSPGVRDALRAAIETLEKLYPPTPDGHAPVLGLEIWRVNDETGRLEHMRICESDFKTEWQSNWSTWFASREAAEAAAAKAAGEGAR